MTTPDERTRAVQHTRDFLQELMDSGRTPGVPDAVREQARRLLRHYPRGEDLRLAHLVLPNQWGVLPDGR
jgi:hypothetical protein